MMLKILLLTMFATAFGRRCQDFQIYPNGQCNAFIRCVGNFPVLMYCPINTTYNSFLKVCDWSNNVICTATTPPTTTILTTRQTTTSTPPTTTTPYIPTGRPPMFCPPDLSWARKVDRTAGCKYYYQCNYGLVRIFSCPADLLFNNLTKVCDLPFLVKC